MAKKVKKKITTVREHPMHVPVSGKNPTGFTIRDQHTRRLKGTYLDLQKNSNTIILKLILISLLQGCVTSQYNANKPNLIGTDIVVSPDRIITECEFIDNYTGDYSDKIIHKAHLVTVRGRGDAEAQIIKSEFKYTFKNHGTYFSNGRSLNFLAIWNDKGQCYSAFNGEGDDCKWVQ